MGNPSVSSNDTGMAFAEEASLKTLPGSPVWYGLEPNSYADLGASYSSVARTPITNTRQRAKGTLTDLDVKGGANFDLTQRNLTRLMQGFFFADAAQKPSSAPFNSAAVPFTSVAVGAFNAASGLGVFKVGNLVKAKNFGISGNNGLCKITTVAAGSLGTSKVLSVEAGPPAAATLEAVGFEFASGDLVMTIVGNTVVLTSAAITMTTLGLVVGEWIYVGGDAAGQQFVTSTNKPFFARVSQINATNIVLDLTIGSATPVADTGTGKTIQIFFGTTINNATTAAAIKRRTYQIERQLGSDGVGIQSEYMLGSIPNEMTINLPQTAKATVDLTFVALDTLTRTGTQGVQTGTRVAAPGESAFNTSHDLVSMRLGIVDGTLNPAALFAYGTEAKITINNGVTPNKALGVLGAFDANAGDFAVSGTFNAYFSTIAAAAAIRANNDACLSAILAANNAGMIFDLPLIALGGGLNKVEKDKSIMVDLSNNAAKSVYGYTMMAVFFEYLPTVAMPA